jgi:hypothetical protein
MAHNGLFNIARAKKLLQGIDIRKGTLIKDESDGTEYKLVTAHIPLKLEKTEIKTEPEREQTLPHAPPIHVDGNEASTSVESKPVSQAFSLCSAQWVKVIQGWSYALAK